MKTIYTRKTNIFENLEKFKDIPNDQYSCTECQHVPEILGLDYDRGIIEFKCTKHGVKSFEIKDYFQKELKYVYYNNECKTGQMKQKDNLKYIYDYCTKCKNYLCFHCFLIHNNHNPFFIKANKVTSICHEHILKYIKYCKECNKHFCQKDTITCKHEIKEIKNPNGIELLRKKRKLLIKKKEKEEALIKLLDIIITTYEKHPSNYFNSINIDNISKQISEDKEDQIEQLIFKINALEKKIINFLNVKLDLQLNGNEIKINLNGKNITNIEFDLLSGVEFKNLEELNISNNNLTNIDSLKNFKSPKLKKIDLSFNKLNDISVFKEISENNKNIEIINLNDNLIKNADIFKQKIFPKIKIINLDNNEILKKDIDEIKKVLCSVKDIKDKDEDEDEDEDEDINIVINLSYKFKNKRERIFGEQFVENNKNKCKIEVMNREIELREYFPIESTGKPLCIKLIMKKKIKNMSYMFHECNTLISISNISNYDFSFVKNISYMFSKCHSLSDFSEISKLNTSNIKNMSGVFNDCRNVSALPDISNWDTSKVTDMNHMFYKCSSLVTLPDISNWNTSKVTNMNHMFYKCKSLLNLPDISKWDISNVTDISFMFAYCSLLSTIPDISKWNISKLVHATFLFSYCTELSSLPDISAFSTAPNIIEKNDIFTGCPKISHLIPEEYN